MKRSYLYFFIVIIALGLNTPANGWWDTQWLFRAGFAVNNPTGQVLTDYQVKYTIDTATLITAGKMNTDASDMRFADAADLKLDYWIESGVNTASTIVWVKIPTLPTGLTTIYMYYGNPVASGESNGDAVFVFFDHFDGTSLDPGKWSVTYGSISGNPPGTITVSNSILDVLITESGRWQNSFVLTSNSDISLSPMAFETIGMNNVNLGHVNFWTSNPPPAPLTYGFGCQFWSHTSGIIRTPSSWIIYWYTSASTLGNHNVLQQVLPDGRVTNYIDNVFRGTSTNTVPLSNSVRVRLTIGDGDAYTLGHLRLDLVRVRRMLVPEPTATPLAEEANPHDFADTGAPVYPTLLSANGARHLVVPGYNLGVLIDAENDGLPDANAMGDDNNNLDDEDGVVFSKPMVPCYAGEMTVTASAAGLLDAWVDFNLNGTWADAGEQIFAGQALAPGPNILPFNVPCGATVTPLTFARFRFSSAGGLSFDGWAPDGEVEDEGVPIFCDFILQNPNGGTLTANAPLNITWTGQPLATHVHLLFSHDGGIHWVTLAHHTENDGLFATFVPALATANGVFRVVNAANNLNFDDSDAPVTITTGPGWVEERTLEAEDFTLTSPMCTGHDGYAFESAFIYSPEKITGTAVQTVNVDPGVYILWGRTLTQNGLANSFYVSIDNGPEVLWDILKVESWFWDVISHRGRTGVPASLAEWDPVLFPLTGGIHTIQFRAREPFTRLDKVFLTNNLHKLVQFYPPRCINILTPADSSAITGGTACEITWEWKNIADSVSIHLSLGDSSFSSPIVIADLTENDGSFLWDVPDTAIDQAYLRIINNSPDGLPFDQTWHPLRITQDRAPQSVNHALYFDGVNDIVEIPNDSRLNITGQFTISFWLKTNDPGQEWSNILEKGRWDEYSVGFYGTTTRLSGALRCNTGQGGTRMKTVFGPSLTSILPDRWYHVALTYDGTSARLYVNGQLETEQKVASSSRRQNLPLVIGASKLAGKYEYFFKGLLDNLEIRSKAGSPQDIQFSMFRGTLNRDENLVAFYNFEDAGGATCRDLSGNGLTGYLGVSNVPGTKPTWLVCDLPGSPAQAWFAQKSDDADQGMNLSSDPEFFKLEQNYPNPFNSGTTFTFNIPMQESGRTQIVLKIYDINGRLISSLVNQAFPSGFHQVHWNGRTLDGGQVPSGIYFYQLTAGTFKETRRMILLK
ncbi:DUF2341 domain-containing protein [candidate division KSB1 bacterium]|nr:DUF2341 domain-containing protein [candidate division KSB1 bacterium]